MSLEHSKWLISVNVSASGCLSLFYSCVRLGSYPDGTLLLPKGTQGQHSWCKCSAAAWVPDGSGLVLAIYLYTTYILKTDNENYFVNQMALHGGQKYDDTFLASSIHQFLRDFQHWRLNCSLKAWQSQTYKDLKSSTSSSGNPEPFVA